MPRKNEVIHQNYNENIRETWIVSIEHKHRFVYLIITLSVAAIGFGVLQIANRAFCTEDVLLAGAFGAWGYTVWLAFETLTYLHNLSLYNGRIIQMKRDDEFRGKPLDRKKLIRYQEKHKKTDNRVTVNLSNIKFYFLAGVAFCVIWLMAVKLQFSLIDTIKI